MSARVVVSCRGGLVDAGSAASTCPSRLPRAPRRVSHARAWRDRRPRAVSTDSPSTDEERTASARPRRRPGRVPLDEYLRLVELADGAWELQSATAVFRRRGATPGDVREVTLAATVHVADAEYYAGLQDECESQYDVVLFELITGERNLVPGEPPALPDRPEDCGVPWGAERERAKRSLEPEPRGSTATAPDDGWDASSERVRRSASPEMNRVNPKPFLPRLALELAPTEDSRALAYAHGLRAQLDELDLTRPSWYVADMPREELLRLQEEAGEAAFASARRDAERRPTSEIPGVGAKARSLVDRFRSGSNRGGGGNAAGALPPALEALVVAARGRAGGGPAKQLARALCWLVPCPEAHLLLLDWVWGGGRPAPVLGAMLDALASGQIESVRRLAFAQMIVSAQAKGAAGGGSEVPVLVRRRNERALECLRVALDAPGVRRVALLYGGLHMPGLAAGMVGSRSVDDELGDGLGDGLGFESSTVRWRSVWRVEAPRNRLGAFRWAALPALLFLDGTDWAATVTDAAEAFSQEAFFASFAVAALYVVRHGAVYYSLGKWVLEWNKQLFDAREGDDGPDGSDGLRG